MTRARFPHGLPSGWFTVAYADELAPGDVRPLHYFGHDLVLSRTEAGHAQLFDAFCPHLGAHLGHGGQIVGERLVCPFHGWAFERSGLCADIPYGSASERVRARAALRAWPLVERNGLLMAWHDREGGAPTWEVPALPEFGDRGWTAYRKGEWRIRVAAQEMAENQVDAAHFVHAHRSAQVPVIVGERDEHVFRARSTNPVTTPIGVVEGQVEVTSYGIGLTTIRLSGLVETLLIAGPTPIDEERSHLRYAFTVRDVGEPLSTVVCDAFVREVQRQLDEDIPIWENKAYLERPLLVDGDGPIGLFRAWARQFYPQRETR